jgi:hypothetical protein
VSYIEPEPGRLARLLEAVGGASVGLIADQLDARLVPSGVPRQLARDVQRELGWLANSADSRKPINAAIHCLCEAP